jgi:hypothetical protein
VDSDYLFGNFFSADRLSFKGFRVSAPRVDLVHAPLLKVLPVVSLILRLRTLNESQYPPPSASSGSYRHHCEPITRGVECAADSPVCVERETQSESACRTEHLEIFFVEQILSTIYSNLSERDVQTSDKLFDFIHNVLFWRTCGKPDCFLVLQSG